MASSGMLRSVALVRTDLSEELSASIIRVTRVGELGRTLAVTSNRSRHTIVFASIVSLLERGGRCVGINPDENKYFKSFYF
jgi:hypothetical protein